MSRLVLIDGNSILNRAFYGIMGSKMLTTLDGKYTNAVYGFLAIMFKVIDDLKRRYKEGLASNVLKAFKEVRSPAELEAYLGEVEKKLNSSEQERERVR